MDLNYTAIIECLLFVSGEPVTSQRLAEVVEVEPDALAGLVAQLNERLSGSGLQVTELAGGYVLTTRPEYADWVQTFLEPDPEKLSVQALETLAIVAYRQPITRPEIDEIRGVNSSGMVNNLVARELVRVAGRKDAPGKPFLLETTPHFLSAFGLKSLGELPRLELLQGREGGLPRLALPVGNGTPGPARTSADIAAAAAAPTPAPEAGAATAEEQGAQEATEP